MICLCRWDIEANMCVCALGAGERVAYTHTHTDRRREKRIVNSDPLEKKKSWLILNIHLLALLSWAQNVPSLICLLLTWGPSLQWNVWLLLIRTPRARPPAGTAQSWTRAQQLAACQVLQSCLIVFKCWWGSLLGGRVLPRPESCSIKFQLCNPGSLPKIALALHCGQQSSSLWGWKLRETCSGEQSVWKLLLVSCSWSRTLNPLILCLGKGGWKAPLRYLGTSCTLNGRVSSLKCLPE